MQHYRSDMDLHAHACLHAELMWWCEAPGMQCCSCNCTSGKHAHTGGGTCQCMMHTFGSPCAARVVRRRSKGYDATVPAAPATAPLAKDTNGAVAGCSAIISLSKMLKTIGNSI